MKHTLLFIFALGLGLLLSPPPAQATGPDALFLVAAADIQAMDAAAGFIAAHGGQVLVTFAPHALLVQLNAADPVGWIGQAGISAIHTGPVDAAAIARQYDEQAGLAGSPWNQPAPTDLGVLAAMAITAGMWLKAAGTWWCRPAATTRSPVRWWGCPAPSPTLTWP